MPHDLRSYLAAIGDQLTVLTEELDPLSNVGAVSTMAPGPFLIERLKGFPSWRLVDLLVSTRLSQSVALGTSPGNVVQHLADRIYSHGPGELRLVDDGPCKEVKYFGSEIDIRTLPIPIHSEGDGVPGARRYLGSGLTVTKDPETGVRNEAFLRTQILDDVPNRVRFSMAPRHNWAHLMKYEARNEPMPIAWVVGLHPAYEILANYSGPHEGFDELALGASALGETLEMVQCETVDLEVPAHAELVVEGLVPPGVREDEGPFGEFTGFRGGLVGPAPVVEITAITHRTDPIFRHMQSTGTTDHQSLVALPMEAAIYNRVCDVQGGVPIHGVHVPPWAGLFTVVIQMTAQWDGQAAAVGLAALSGANLHPKIAIVVDEDVALEDAHDILWAVTQRVDPARDITVVDGQRIHPLDQSVSLTLDSATQLRVGGKMVIDATRPPRYRAEARAEFERVKPMGADDPELRRLLERAFGRIRA